jgi:PAS domain S-box-containing protein
MNATASDRRAPESSPRRSRMRWHLDYCFLAGLVSVSLFLNHRLVVTHQRTVEGNLQWVAWVSQCDTLAKYAGAVNTPVGDFLESHDTNAESLRTRTAFSQFNDVLTALCAELSHNVSPRDASILINDCETVRKKMNHLVERADAIFSSIRENEPDEMHAQIASMGHDYDDVLRSLDLLRVHLRTFRKAYLEAQVAEARDIARFEWVLGGIILVLLAGVAFYGARLERHASASEAAFFASEHKYRELVEQSSDAIIATDDQWNIRLVNTAACQILGYPEAELLQLNVLDTYATEEREDGVQRRQGLAVGQTRVFERAVQRKDGTRFPAEIVVRRVGTCVFQGILRDITARKRAEADLETLHKRLRDNARQAGMAEMATSVLHNVGNVLNSLNVSFAVVSDRIRQSKLSNLAKAAVLLEEHKDNLATFLSRDPKGRQLPGYLIHVTEHLTREQTEVLHELKSLIGNVQHIKEIVAMQQSYSKTMGAVETLSAADLVEDALRMNASSLSRHEVQIIREYSETPPVVVDKHKAIQILVNLVRNAKHALDDGGSVDKQLIVRLAKNGDDFVHVSIVDNGVGISPENLTRLFEYGFTTRKNGHGFGLHGSVRAAQELGGTLTVQSEGLGRGATFILSLPTNPKVDNP